MSQSLGAPQRGSFQKVNPAAPTQTGILQHGDPNVLVIPRDPLSGDLKRSAVGRGVIHRLLDRSARGALADCDHHTGFLGRSRHLLAQVSLLFQRDQEFAHHIAAEKFVIRVPRTDTP